MDKVKISTTDEGIFIEPSELGKQENLLRQELQEEKHKRELLEEKLNSIIHHLEIDVKEL